MKNLSGIIMIVSLLLGCSQSSDELSIAQNSNELNVDIKLAHDQYCILIRDSILSWRETQSLEEDRIGQVWHLIQPELAKTLGTDVGAIKKKFAALQIDESNWTEIRTEKYNLLPRDYQLFVDDLRNVFMENLSASDEELMLIFEEKKTVWSTLSNPQVVNSTIEVAKSSFVFWRNNFASVDHNGYARKSCWTCIGKLATGDVVGGAWGGLTAGPAGALLGAVGGTLSATISGTIFGFE